MANWIDDPQGREEVEKVTQELKLPILKPNAKGKFRPWLTEVWGKIEDYLINLKNIANSKEPAITKKSAFNLDKTDLTENNSNKLFTAKGALGLFNTLTTNFTNAVNTAKEYFRTELVKKIDKTSISDSLSSTSQTTVLSSAGAKALEDKKLNISDAWKQQVKPIGNSTTPIDLNTITEAGEYISTSASNRWINLPAGADNHFHLTVESIGGNYRVQTLRHHTDNRMFRRVNAVWDRWAWSAWERIDIEAVRATTLAGYGITDFLIKELTTEDLNNIRKSGIYMCGSSSNATLSRKYPIEEAGTLEVFGVFASMCTQRYTTISKKVYIRNVYFSDLNGATWIRVDSLEKVSKTGDTMSGNLDINKADGSYNLSRNGTPKMFLGFRNGTNTDIVWHAREHGTEIALQTDKVFTNKEIYVNNAKTVTEADRTKYSLFYPNTDKTLNNTIEAPIEFFDTSARNSFNFIYSSADKSLKCTKGGLYRINLKLYAVIETSDPAIRSLVRFYKNSEILAYFELQGRRGMSSSTNIVRLNQNDKLYIKHTNIAENYERVFKGGLELNNILIERLGD